MIKNKLTARLEEINAKIEDLKITAPFSGLTGIRNFSEGSLLMPGDIVTELYDINKLKILAKVPEIFISKISRKTSFSLTSSINKDYKIDGKVSIIDPLIDDETRTFKIIGVIKNANNILKPGQMVNLKFEFDKRESLFVRENSVFNQDDISYLYLVNKGNNIEKKRVKLGARKNGLVEILDGLNSSDLVVFEGINKVKEGSIVKIK